jgi:hypothetical protein
MIQFVPKKPLANSRNTPGYLDHYFLELALADRISLPPYRGPISDERDAA